MMDLAHRRLRVLRIILLLAFVLASGPAEGSVSAQGKGKGEHFCLSINGEVLVQRGTATCFTDNSAITGVPRHSYARASGEGATAGASNGGKAAASGTGSRAFAENLSTATASGTNSQALAIDRSQATANGDESYAEAIIDATAIATGFSSFAHASTGSTAIATGDCDASADGGVTDTCTGP